MKGKRIFFSVVLSLLAVCGTKAEGKVADRLEKAGDFVYTPASGEKGSLYALSSNWLLLYFYDPTCEDCQALMEKLSTSDVLNRLIAEGELQVLAIYPDNDSAQWKNYATHIPATWINGYDEHSTIILESNYMFRSLPALYLLDKEKYIRLQETTAEAVEKELKK